MVRIRTERFLKFLMNLAVEDLSLEFDQVIDALIEYESAGMIQLSTKKPIYWVFRLPYGDKYYRESFDKYSVERFKLRVRKEVIEIYYQPEGPIFDLLPSDLYRIRLPFK